MGSTVVPLGNIFSSEDLAGDLKQQMTYLQFVPALVTDVVTSYDSESHEGVEERVGSIKALPHINAKGIKRASFLGEESRYYPLLRGMQDIPVKGDPVLVITIGDRGYYLGPINTQSSPNFNIDKWSKAQVTSGGVFRDDIDADTPNTFQRAGFDRLQKPIKKILDAPLNVTEDGKPDPDYFMGTEIHGDTIFEGRHGNSVRIGSRNINPYIFISNGRDFHQHQESSLDGSILAMINQGTLRHHFDTDMIENGNSPEVSEETTNQGEDGFPLDTTNEDGYYNFALADESIPVRESLEETTPVFRSISKTFASSYGRGLGPHPTSGKNPVEGASGQDDPDIEKTIYGYKGKQTLLSSDRITFNARDESMFLAARKFIHLGAHDSITITANNTCLLKAATRVIIEDTPLFEVYSDSAVYIDGRDKIVFGNPNKDDYINSAVMGESFVTYMVTIINEIKNMCHLVGMSIEQSKKPGAAMDNMKKAAKGFDDIMGMEAISDEELEVTYEWPKAFADAILSKKVYIKR